MHYTVIIVGGGPGGLSCAKTLARHGHSVLVLERKSKIGPKVCAGGITWSGLINAIPGHIEENRFPDQYVFTDLQSASIHEREPIIATVNRERLGQHMAEIASEAGAEIRTSCQVVEINGTTVTFIDKSTGLSCTAKYDHLVGADGSNSLVRRYLGVKTRYKGVGINYQVPGSAARMEWHLNSLFFRNGYGWIFPHAQTISVGAYADQSVLSAAQLKVGLIEWATDQGYDLANHKPRAEFINFDFRGWKFDNVYLVGDAAGFASGLTGEGIYPAIVSGEHVGNYIDDSDCDLSGLNRLIRMRDLHAKMVRLTGRNQLLAKSIAEIVTFLLRYRFLDFRKLEMAN